MKISEHTASSEKQCGIRGEDIHKWIDGFFDYESLSHFLKAEQKHQYDPYGHRQFRHCTEALEEAYQEFEHKYSHKQIKAVFECHLKDDYDGYLPSRDDFINGTFKEKYHEEEKIDEKDSILSSDELNQYFKGKRYSKFKNPNRKLSSVFRLKIVMPTIVAIILFVTSVFAVIVPIFRSNIIDSKKEMIKELTAASISIIQEKIDLAESGDLSEDEAKKQALGEIQGMRYGENYKDYFWITDMTPRMLMHPYRTELTGKDLSDYKDRENKSGKKLFVEFVGLVEDKGEGYLQYLWQWKDDSSRIAPKLSYVKGIPEWGWIIGTGIYINDVTDEINALTWNLLMIFSLISAVLIALLTYVIMQSFKIDSGLSKAESGLREAKNRYRALVEASSEGHILVMDGISIYSNHRFKKLFGMEENEIIRRKVFELLPDDLPWNQQAIEELSKIADGEITETEFEAQIRSIDDRIVDVIFSTSKIFFSEKKGCIISVRPIARKKVNFLLESYGSSKFHPGSLFMSKKVGEICSPVGREVINEISNTYIPQRTPVYEALALLKHHGVDTLFVTNEFDEVVGQLGYYDISMMYAGLPTGILYNIKHSDSMGSIVKSLERMPELVLEFTRQGASSEVIRDTIGKVYEAAIRKFIKISLMEVEFPDVKFAFLSLGSTARHEMTLFSDQDNALIFEDVDEKDLQKVRMQFLNLSDKVCSKMQRAGYPYCPGGIMAVNPKWCLSLSEWKSQFQKWITTANPESLLGIHVFFDIDPVYGKKSLMKDLNEHINKLLNERPDFFVHYARNCLTYKEPISYFGTLRAETKGGVKSINLKECLMPIVNFARIYALRYQITEPSTKARLEQLCGFGVLKEKSFHELVYMFNHLWHLRFYNQMVAHEGLMSVNDELNIEHLTEIEKNNLKNILSEISKFQSKINYDFLGGSA
jgi:PAS domain S-box-containing protein